MSACHAEDRAFKSRRARQYFVIPSFIKILRCISNHGKEFRMITIDEFKKVELIIAQIKEVKEHPNADRLYVLKIDTGKEEKQLVAGIRLSYTKEQLVGRRVVMVNNLQPAVIRGEESHGMVLAVSDEQGIALLGVDRDMPLGSIVK